jgi:hypothetical protein
MSELTTPKPNKMPTHIARAPMRELSLKAKQCIGKYKPRIAQPGEAQNRENDLWSRDTYRVGDGDNSNEATRPGSMDAYKLPNRGIAT